MHAIGTYDVGHNTHRVYSYTSEVLKQSRIVLQIQTFKSRGFEIMIGIIMIRFMSHVMNKIACELYYSPPPCKTLHSIPWLMLRCISEDSYRMRQCEN